jgi:uncharacterized membrane protein YfcA
MFLAFLFLISAAAFAISTVSGGGAGLLLLPVLRSALAAPQVPVALSIGSTVSSLARLSVFIRDIDWHLVRAFVPLSIPGACLGVWMLSFVSSTYLEAALGLFLLGNLPLLFRRNDESPAESQGAAKVALLGFVAGFISGLTGAVGLLFNRFYLRRGLSRQRVVATRAANEILLHLTKLGLYAVFGLYTLEALHAGLVVGVAATFATLGVKKILPYLSEALFRRIGYAAMVLAGSVMTLRAGAAAADQHGVVLASKRVARGADLSLHGFGGWVIVELRRGELPEVEYRIAFDDLPADRKEMAAPLMQGAERVVVEAVRGWRTLGYELYVHRDGIVTRHVL